MNETITGWDNDNVTANMTDKEYIFETTEWISYDLAPSSRYCMSTIMDGYSWGLRKSEQFNSWGDVFEAWL